MDVRDMARLGAIATNKILTKETRSKAAKKGWRRRRNANGEIRKPAK